MPKRTQAKKSKKKKFVLKTSQVRVLHTFASAIVIALGALAAINYAKGNYRLTNEGVIQNTGLLSANSFPTGAQVFINDRLVSATDDTLYLEPGKYQVKIVKDGFTPWEKEITLEKELVAQTNSLLFPSAPSLTPLTFTGAQNLSPAPDGQKLIYYTNSAASADKNGLYILELDGNLLPLQKSSRQISGDVASWDLKGAKFIWAPDSSQVMLSTARHSVILDINKKQTLTALTDVSLSQKRILSQWEEEMYLRERQFLSKFPEEIIYQATTSAKNVYISPDKKKILYTATADITLPENIIPPVLATNTQPEERNLEIGGVYVYDSKEDKNFRVGSSSDGIGSDGIGSESLAANKTLLSTDLYNEEPLSLAASPSAFTHLQASNSAQTAKKFQDYHTALYPGSFQWFPDSRHLIVNAQSGNAGSEGGGDGGGLKIMEYDGTNQNTIYSGELAENFVYPWPNGEKMLILTAFSQNSPLNLYAVELK